MARVGQFLLYASMSSVSCLDEVELGRRGMEIREEGEGYPYLRIFTLRRN